MLLLEGGRLLCTAVGLDQVGDLLIKDGRIEAIDPGSVGDAQRVDCRGLVVTPALIDLDARLCDPGFTWRESLESGSAAAKVGGFTTVVANPETRPVVDDPAIVRDLLARAAIEMEIELLVAGGLTRGLEGTELAELGLMLDAGAVALSNSDALVSDSLVLRNALLYARPFDRPVMLRGGDAALEKGAVMHEGVASSLAGLRGHPAAAEESGIARVAAMARYTGGRVHITGVSSALGVDVLRRVQSQGVAITASTTALHTLLTDEIVLASGYDTDARLLPPLRAEADRLALIEGLRDGVLSAVTSAHTPWTREEKELEFAYAQPGAVGLETALSATVLGTGSLELALQSLSSGPASVLRLKRALTPGAPAELIVLDADARWTVEPARFRSKGRNTPLKGMEVPVLVRHTIHRGQLIHSA